MSGEETLQAINYYQIYYLLELSETLIEGMHSLGQHVVE